MIVADANVVIAASTPGHSHHASAQEILREHGPRGIVLPTLTMAEVLVGSARAGAEDRARHLLSKAGFDLLPAEEPTPEDLARLQAGTSLKMPDVCVLATAEHLQVGLATFDARLAREAEARGVTVLGLPSP